MDPSGTEHQNARPRLGALDLLRGLLVTLMALDHANYFIAQSHSSGEYWGGYFPQYSSAVPFLIRFVTHICAPGFFFLMGASMSLFSHSRQRSGWTPGMVRVHFLLRGAALVLLQLLVVNLFWSLAPGSFPRWYIGVLSALGVGMIICIPLLELKPASLAGIALGLFVLLELFTPAPEMWGTGSENLAGTLLVYGGGNSGFWVNYPLLAWLEVLVFGLAFGGWLELDQTKTFRTSPVLGMFFLAGFLLLRLNHGFGNIRPFPEGSWIDFLNMVKYPPSMTFVLFTMGVILLLVGLFATINPALAAPGNPLLVFGRAPLFAYLTHLGIYAGLGRLLTPQGSSLEGLIPLWLLGLFLVYWPARWYGKYRSSQPARSWVRLL